MLAKKFVRVFPYDGTGKANELFGQANIIQGTGICKSGGCP